MLNFHISFTICKIIKPECQGAFSYPSFFKNIDVKDLKMAMHQFSINFTLTYYLAIFVAWLSNFSGFGCLNIMYKYKNA